LHFVTASGDITSGSTFLGGNAPSATIATLVGGCDIDVPSPYTLSTAGLNGVMNMQINDLYVESGATCQLGTPSLTNGFRFISHIKLEIYGLLSFVGGGGGILIPTNSALDFYPGGSFLSLILTYLQVFDPITGLFIGSSYMLSLSFAGPLYFTISALGQFLISILGPGLSDVTQTPPSYTVSGATGTTGSG